MPEYLSPGVYIEEFEIGAKPIEGVSTSTAGFLGRALRGPEEPRLITGLSNLSGYMEVTCLSTIPTWLTPSMVFLRVAAEVFCRSNRRPGFRHHDRRSRHRQHQCHRPRPVGQQDSAQDRSRKPSGRYPGGTLGSDKADGHVLGCGSATAPPVDPTKPANATNSNRREPVLLEVYDNLSSDPKSIDFFETRINKNSKLIRIRPLDPANPVNPASARLISSAETVQTDQPPV